MATIKEARAGVQLRKLAEAIMDADSESKEILATALYYVLPTAPLPNDQDSEGGDGEKKRD